MYICMCVYRNVFTPNLKLKQVTKKLKRGERCGWKKPGREKYLTKASPVKREREREKKKKKKDLPGRRRETCIGSFGSQRSRNSST